VNVEYFIKLTDTIAEELAMKQLLFSIEVKGRLVTKEIENKSKLLYK
jgi:hypothetical protein